MRFEIFILCYCAFRVRFRFVGLFSGYLVYVEASRSGVCLFSLEWPQNVALFTIPSFHTISLVRSLYARSGS
jgi:hypothetical protein